ncbi:MAG: L-serine ammonia-lyase [Phycisphaerae bacterium]|jgi:L-serine dehydratase
MKSIKCIYKVGKGPSSSHTMGPQKAALIFKNKVDINATTAITVELYGSLAATGKGHLADSAIIAELSPLSITIKWFPDQILPLHPNGMIFRAFDYIGNEIINWVVYSVGGGELIDAGGDVEPLSSLKYDSNTIEEIISYCHINNKKMWEYVMEVEGDGIKSYLSNIWNVMKAAIRHGITQEAVLPGYLRLERRAKMMFKNTDIHTGILQDLNYIFCYALAVAEENASGGIIVTAPTCGSCGILPGILYYLSCHHQVPKEKIIQGIMTAGLFASAVCKSASISGAQVGCQGEIGTACAMAAAATCQILGGNNDQIEYAAEMALEHNFGLTCDPVGGFVQIPCIERNAFGATRAFECATYAISTNGKHKISFDTAVKVMYTTGRDMQSKYRETAIGGLASIIKFGDFKV